MPWMAAIFAAVPLLLGGRSSSDEIPGMDAWLAQMLSGERDAQIFSRAAVDPTSDWFKGLSGVLEEDLQNQAHRGIRRQDIDDMRKINRGIPTSLVRNPERRDESRYSAWIDALQGSKLTANTLTPQLLLSAAKASGGGDPSDIFSILQGYGDTNAGQQTDFTESIFNILKGLLGSSSVIGGSG